MNVAALHTHTHTHIFIFQTHILSLAFSSPRSSLLLLLQDTIYLTNPSKTALFSLWRQDSKHSNLHFLKESTKVLIFFFKMPQPYPPQKRPSSSPSLHQEGTNTPQIVILHLLLFVVQESLKLWLSQEPRASNNNQRKVPFSS